MVIIKLKYNLVETPRKFTTAKISIRKLGSVSANNNQHLIIMVIITVSTDEDPSLRAQSSAIINLRGVSTKLYFDKILSINELSAASLQPDNRVYKLDSIPSEFYNWQYTQNRHP